jgi:hypothetical protein
MEVNQAVKDVTTTALTIPNQAKAIKVIENNKQYEKAGALLLNINDLMKKIDATFDPIIKKAHETHREAIQQKNSVTAPLTQAAAYIKPLMVSFTRREEEKRLAEERRLQEEQKKKEEEARLEGAITAESMGDTETAEALLDMNIRPAAVVVPKTVSAIKGLATQKIWKWRIDNAELIPREYMMVDESKIGKIVKALKDQTKIPGITAYEEEGIRATGR